MIKELRINGVQYIVIAALGIPVINNRISPIRK